MDRFSMNCLISVVVVVVIVVHIRLCINVDECMSTSQLSCCKRVEVQAVHILKWPCHKTGSRMTVSGTTRGGAFRIVESLPGDASVGRSGVTARQCWSAWSQSLSRRSILHKVPTSVCLGLDLYSGGSCRPSGCFLVGWWIRILGWLGNRCYFCWRSMSMHTESLPQHGVALTYKNHNPISASFSQSDTRQHGREQTKY